MALRKISSGLTSGRIAKLFVLLFLFLLGVIVYKNYVGRKDGFSDAGSILFNPTSYNFGKIKKGVSKTAAFTFINTQSITDTIQHAFSNCDCLTVEYNLNPVLKGQNGTIFLKYTAPDVGVFKKNVTVQFARGNVTELTVEGEVIA